MICTKCRAITQSEMVFCSRCGTPLGKSDAIRNAKRLNARNPWGVSRAPGQPVGEASAAAGKAGSEKEPDHLIPWLLDGVKKAVKSIPNHLVSLAIYAGVVLFVNLVFWTANTYMWPAWLAPVKQLVSLVVFLTATYNDILPKTVFWVLVFTFGKKLFKTMRKKGFLASFACMKRIVPEFSEAVRHVGKRANGILLVGIGIGLAIANNFASYSRFSGARNKMDKYFIVFVMAFAISYLLGESKKSGIFRFVKLGTRDVVLLAGRSGGLSDEGVYVLMTGFVAGLLLDAPLILMKWMYGGYLMGLAAVIAGVALLFTAGRKKVMP